MSDLRKALEQAIEALHSDNPEIQLRAVIKVLVEMSASAEREACAKVCEKERNDLLWREGQTLPQGEPRLIHMANTAGHCAEAIRARGEK